MKLVALGFHLYLKDKWVFSFIFIGLIKKLFTYLIYCLKIFFSALSLSQYIFISRQSVFSILFSLSTHVYLWVKVSIMGLSILVLFIEHNLYLSMIRELLAFDFAPVPSFIGEFGQLKLNLFMDIWGKLHL